VDGFRKLGNVKPAAVLFARTEWLRWSGLQIDIDDQPADARPGPRSTGAWVSDTVLFLLSLAVAAISALSMHLSGASDRKTATALAVAGVACLLLWGRLRWPVGVALAMAPLVILSLLATGAALVALFTVAARRRLATAALVGALYLLVTFVHLWHRMDDLSDWTSILPGILVTAAALTWGALVRARQKAVWELHERARRAEEDQQRRVQQAEEEERSRIAREMHDLMAHRISLVSLHAAALEFQPDLPAEQVGRIAGVIRDNAHQSLEELREIIGLLREESAPDAPRRPLPSAENLAELVEQSRLAGMSIRLDNAVSDLGSVPDGVGRNAYRILQEGLTNARKHAADAPVTVSLRGAAGSSLEIEVTNPRPAGAASAQIPGSGTGLVGLRERVRLAGGRLEHGITPAGQFYLFASIPWSA
jgi:signal transduction histidine kinase